MLIIAASADDDDDVCVFVYVFYSISEFYHFFHFESLETPHLDDTSGRFCWRNPAIRHTDIENIQADDRF